MIPCTHVLSVAGFYAVPMVFPGREWFIPEGILAPACPTVLTFRELKTRTVRTS